ncbi:hypothetical protein Pcinc_026821 [Petrolisthes cinctipes]|uniref:Uncharacterized protein n=1 Tax=Petrolisthes cinctipes TaxID=88211 RepID=A0AAE1K7L4_PETCI|nr:hypothetical protein Pcinc_026821 [Petrolisthes cinctipes]
MAATTSSCCFCCRTWGHKAACAAPGPRCGVCSCPHWTEACLASRKNGEQVKACCTNCRLGHHAWNPGCPARPTAGGDPSCSRNGLQAVLLEISEGFAELLGTDSPVTCCVGTRAAPWGCSVGTQAAAPRSGGVATQTPSPPTQERAPPPPPAAGGESSPPSSNQATQPDGETPKDLDLDEAFLVQPKKKKKKGSPTATTTQMLDAHFAARGLKIKRRKQ